MRGYHSSSKKTVGYAAAFTLIELLVVLGIMGILIAILLPVLFGTKAAGSEVVTLSNLRQLGATMEAYLAEYDQAYPYAPPDTWLVISPPDEGEIDMIKPGYWDLDVYWTALMHDIAPWREHFSTWIGPGGVEDESAPWRRKNHNGTSSYYLSHTFFAAAALWAPATKDDPAFYRAVRAQEVLYPASKVMMWDAELTHLASSPNADRDHRPMLFADGHVKDRRLSEAAVPPEISFKPDTQPVQDTPKGVHGRDY